MSVRNIAIVFSPTLGIPAGIFTLMLAEFSNAFEWSPDNPSREKEASELTVEVPDSKPREVVEDDDRQTPGMAGFTQNDLLSDDDEYSNNEE
jgi:RalA-binding protein 1